MEWLVDRRQGPGRRSSDARDAQAVCGLLHDLEHGMATLSSLIAAAHGDPSLSIGSRTQLERAEGELARLSAFIIRWAAGPHDAAAGGAADAVDVRALAGEVAQLAEIEHGATVVLLPGPEVSLPVSFELLWRLLVNVVDNAARAAGPTGRVEVAAIDRRDVVVIEVSDNGPGFGNGPSGFRSIGMSVITSLLRSVGGQFEVRGRPAGGTTVRAIFPSGVETNGAVDINLGERTG